MALNVRLSRSRTGATSLKLPQISSNTSIRFSMAIPKWLLLKHLAQFDVEGRTRTRPETIEPQPLRLSVVSDWGHVPGAATASGVAVSYLDRGPVVQAGMDSGRTRPRWGRTARRVER